MKEEHERIPLRTILQNFLNHVENLDSDNLEGSYEKEFQELKLFSEILKTSDQYCCSEGQKEVNRKKNRYKDILPFDVSRVILAGYAGVPGSDYINANFIKGASGSLAYIASQGPLPHTVNDFWRMVVECKVQVIVMACNEEEAGKHKCENYWVDKEGEEKQFGMVAVRLVKASVVCPDFLVRTMMLKYANSQSVSEERTVCQFHYSAWPDHGVPPLVRPLLDMVRLVRDTQASETLPVLVHCSAGCGRTGTICAIDYVWGLLRAGKLTNDFSLFKLVRDMRKQRIAMVQTKEQYVLVHHAVRELFCEQLRMIDSHPYENIDVNGMPLIKECCDSDSEPTYAVIGNISCDEKQDNKEKEVYAPPIPQKKRLHTPSSKQEKEVENLTEKQRLISQQSSDSSSFQGSGTPQKPRIAKLKAIFERSSQSGDSHTRSKLRSTQQVTRSHSLGAVSKPDTHHRQAECPRQNENDLSVSRHKLNAVAHSSPVSPQPAIPIKRSKSLKVLGSGDQYKLIFTTVSKDSPGKVLRTVGSSENSVKKLEAGPSMMGSGQSSKLKEQLECEKVKTKSATSCVKSTNFNGGNADYNMKPSLNFRASEHSVPMCSQHRSSLDSFSTDDMLQFPLVNANSGVATKVSSSSSNSSNSTYGFNHVKTYNEQKTSALDKDACQIWQDCRNYLISNSKCDGYLPKGLVNKRQQSDLTDSMLKHKQFQNYSIDSQKKVTSVVVGLGVRERRNSFRQAVGTPKESSGVLPEKEWRTYESGWVGGNVQQNVDNVTKKSISSRTQVLSEVTGANSLHCSPHVSNSYVDVFPNSVVPVTSLQVAAASSVDTSARNYNSRVQRLNKPRQDKKTGIQKTSDEVSFCETIGSPYNTVLKHTSPNTKTGVIGHKYVHNPTIQESRSLGQSKIDSVCIEQVKNAPVLKRTFQKPAWPLIEQGSSKITPDLSVRNLSGSSTATVKQLNTDCQEVNHSFAKRTPSSEGLSLFKSAPVSLKSKSKSFIDTTGIDVVASKSNNTSANNAAPVPSIKCVCDIAKSDMGKKVVIKSDPSQPVTPLCEKINGFKADTSRRMADKRTQSHSTSIAVSRSAVEAGDNPSNKRLKDVPSGFSDSDSKSCASNKIQDLPLNEKLSPKQQHQNEQDVVSYGLVAGVQLRRGTRDDMACQGPSTSAKVRRHASVVLLRHSLIETTPLTVWGPEQQGFTPKNSKVSPKRQGQDTGSEAITASTKPQGDTGTSLSRTLEALHLKKPSSHTAEVPSVSSGKTYGVVGIRSPRAQKKQHYL